MKKLSLILLFSILYSLFSIHVSPVLAQDREKEFQEAITDPGYGKEKFDLKTVEDLMLTIMTAVGGPLEVSQGPSGPVYSRSGGAMGMASNLVTTLYATQPASSIEYLADISSRLGLAKPVYAQGLGWTAFSPVLGLWKLFRNIAYLAFVVIFVAIGFMIMFRTKINPQTVISVQNALPRIIVTLLLITFSYAIAGFVIDLGQVSTRIIGNTLAGKGLIAVGVGDYEARLNNLLSTDIFKLVNPLRDPSAIAEAIAGIEMGPTQVLPSWLAEITVKLIFWIAGFFIMFKIFFALIGPYVSIILSIIFAPFQLLLGAFPGTTGGLGNWLRGLLANVMVFPVTFAMLAIAAILRGPATYSGADWGVPGGEYEILWAPTTIGTWGGAVPHLIAFGILFTIPHVAKIVKEALAVKEKPWAAAPGAEIKAAMGRIPLVGGVARRFIE